MSYNWGPHYLVPTDVLKSYSGTVVLREEFSDELLHKEMEALGIAGSIERITNPWYYRGKGEETWIKIGESSDAQGNFPIRWDTSKLKNGQYQVMGLMHVFIKKNNVETALARQNIVEVKVQS